MIVLFMAGIKMYAYGYIISECGCGNKEPEVEFNCYDYDIFVRIRCNCGANGNGPWKTTLLTALQQWDVFQKSLCEIDTQNG